MTAPIDPAGREVELRALADAVIDAIGPGPWVPGSSMRPMRDLADGVPWLLDRLAELRAENERLKRRTTCDACGVNIEMLNGIPWHTYADMAMRDEELRIAAEAERDRLQRQVDAVRAETLREAADEVHREARWQQEMILRGQGQHIQSVGRLLVVESILLNRAAALDAVQPETEER